MRIYSQPVRGDNSLALPSPDQDRNGKSRCCFGFIGFYNRLSQRISRQFCESLFRLFFLFSLILTGLSFMPTAQAETLITNTANATFSINGVAQAVSDSVQFSKNVVVTPPDELNLSKKADLSRADVDDLITYTLTIENPNDNPLDNVVIQDALPVGLLYQNGSATLDNQSISDSQVTLSGQKLSLDLGTLAKTSSHEVRYRLRVSSSAPAGVAINQAVAISDTATSLPAQASVNITITPPAKPLLLDKKAQQTSASIGDTVRFSLTIQNINPYAISNVVLEDTLPAGLSFVSGSAKLDKGSTTTGLKALDANTRPVLIPLGDIPAAAKWTLTVDAVITDALVTTGDKVSSLTNLARLVADDSAADSAASSATVQIESGDILIRKTADKARVMAGDPVRYNVTVTNPSAYRLSNLNLQDSLPAGFDYQSGSTTVNGNPLGEDKVISTGRALQIQAGSLAAAKSMQIGYTVLVSEQAKSGDAVNQVLAESDYALSDMATATVKVRTPSTIEFLKIDANGIEEIIQPTAFNSNQNGGKTWQPIDAINLPDGSRINLPTPQPLIKAEQYASSEPIVIEVRDLDQNTDPGKLNTIIVTIEVPGTGDSEVLLLTETGPDTGVFRGVILTSADTTGKNSGVLSLRQGSKISVNYRDEEDSTDVSATAAIVVPDTRLGLGKESDKEIAAVGELVRYTLTFNNTTRYNLPDLTIEDILPPGFRYLNGSASLNGVKLGANKVSTTGRELYFSLDKMPAGAQWSLDYVTKVTAGVQFGNAINEARITSGSIQSNRARATVKIEDDLMRTRNILTGRVYIGCEGTPSGVKKDDKKYPAVLKDARIYLETGRNVLSDEEGFWHMEGVEPGTHVLQLDEESLPPGYEPMLCLENTRHAGDAKSQFVDLQPGGIWQVDFHVKKVDSQKSTDNHNPALKNKVAAPNPVTLYNADYVKTAATGFEILWPKNNYVPAVASTKIFVKSSPKQKVDLFLNGKPVSALNYDGSDTNKARTVTVRRWYGVDLDIKRRNNQLLAVLKDNNGKEIARQTRNIHFSGEPATAELLPELSVLVADGKTTPVIALRIRDEDGFPMRANTHGYYSIENSQFQVKTLTQENDKLSLNESLASGHKYLIEEGGIAYIQLNPTTQSGELTLNLKFTDRKSIPIRVWLKPNLRDWILVGFAEGTLAHKSVNGNLRTLRDLDKEDSFVKSGRVAFFAKGKIRGKYLLTVAYDTHKRTHEPGTQLNGTIDPDAWYTVYADNSNSQYDAPSSRKLYVKLERETFYALFGDFRSGMSVTELASYERVMNGIKSEYKGERYSYNAFISQTSNQHHRDEIPGDGTSGLYRLSSDILPNSETVTIETRDRFHSERLIESRALVRYQDYDIDYDAGTLYFKFPVTSRDRDFNPNIIVVEYDSESDSNREITAGGRVAMHSRDRRLEAGLSALREGRNKAKDNTLIAADVTYQITPDTRLRAEVAQSKTEQSDYRSRKAYIVELEKQIANMEARLYHRKQDEQFGISSQASESGTQKTGAEVRYRHDENTEISAELSHQKNLANDNQRQLAQVDARRRFDRLELRAGARHSREELEEETISNNTLLAGAAYTTENGRITLRGDIEKNVSQEAGSENSPDRAIVGVDVKLDHGFSVFAEHETTDNGEIRTHNNRVGVSKPLWEGAKARTTYTQERTDQGQRNYATLGLDQRIQLSEKLKADFTIDHAKTLADDRVQARLNENEPAIQGAEQDDFTAFTVGLGADDKLWSWTTRFEVRKGDITDKINFRGGLIRHLEDGKNLSARLSHSWSESDDGRYENLTRLSLGSAWHPRNKNFVFLNRLDLVNEKTNQESFAFENDTSQGGLESHTQKIIHNMHYSHKLNDKTQISLHHGIKHVKDAIGEDSHSATIDTATLEIRRDINKKWDIGVHGGYLHDWSEGSVDAVAGVSVGVTPMENAWVALGYNFEGFYDKDFDKSEYKRQGPYLNFRYKFNQDSFDGDLPIRRKYKNKKIAIEQDNSNDD